MRLRQALKKSTGSLSVFQYAWYQQEETLGYWQVLARVKASY